MKTNNQKGFTLIELMVVIGIIGIITGIAVPSFQRFQAKAKQANAKVELSAIYGMEKAFFTEFGSFHENLIMIGYTPDGVPLDANGCIDATNMATTWPTRYYAVGSAGGVTGNLGGVTEPCAGTLSVPENPAAAVALTAFAGVIAQGTFTMEANGQVGGSREDMWTINENKQLRNVQVGF